MKNSKKAFLVILAVGCILPIGCNRARISYADKQSAMVFPALDHMRSVKKVDQATLDYLKSCENSTSFRLQARVTPIIYEAVKDGYWNKDQAIAEYEKVKKMHPETAQYWDGCISHFQGQDGNSG